jgi:hypothetical protein
MYGSPTLGPYEKDVRYTYPVNVEFIIPARNSRFWAIPILGYLLRPLVLLPHFIVLAFLGLAVVLCQLVLWVPVLFAGRYPRWGYSFVGGYLRWSLRLQAFLLGLTDSYPPFRLSS